jgi:hypothetical protein
MFEWLGRVSYQRRWLVLAGTLFDRVPAHVVTHRVGVSDRLTQQPLHPMRRTVSRLLG